MLGYEFIVDGLEEGAALLLIAVQYVAFSAEGHEVGDGELKVFADGAGPDVVDIDSGGGAYLAWDVVAVGVAEVGPVDLFVVGHGGLWVDS